ncbi:MAG: histidine--tRNA ligase [Clostridia bacterium]|nr:histidine--tRNA ligase [Clostridia bacterium]
MIKMPRGTKDILPDESFKWQYVEDKIKGVCRDFNFKEIRFPTFEHTELFKRGVGDTTDVVQKEMYTFSDKDQRSLTLRPEGTAGVMRSFVEHGLYGGALPLKLYYLISCFRYEKPQAGRLREFHQFGVELLGSPSPAADAEVISLANAIFERLGVKDLSLIINSLGCRTCRKEHSKALKEYFTAHVDGLCDTCRERLQKNPMRIIDCKNDSCKEIAKGAPSILDYICDDCSKHFEETKRHLTAAGIKYTVDPTIVRGLDYYSKTVFEFVSGDIGAQSTVCGGGRYDYLARELGDIDCAGLGFAMGIERLLLVMEAQGLFMGENKPCDLYIASMGDEANVFASGLAAAMRAKGVSVETDLMKKSLKAQMKYSDRLGARFCIVIGESEMETRKAQLKNMATGEKTDIDLSDVSAAAGLIKSL